MVTDARVVVIGAGQAGLAVSHELTSLGIEHVVLERARIGEAWRGRWDSFCLVTPNWTMMLPGMAYQGDDPEGFAPRDEMVRFLEDYAASFAAPVRYGVSVDGLEPGFVLHTSAGDIHADAVVVCTGAFQKPHRPLPAPPGVHAMDVDDYRSPAALPDGKVLIIGAGQSGAQIAEELTEAGREVYLACGKAPWAPRRIDGRDIVTWLRETTFFDQPLPAPGARLMSNPLLSGHSGGHDVGHRTLQAMGVHLTGHVTEFADNEAHFADDLAESVAFSDARYADLAKVLEPVGAKLPEPPPFHATSPARVKLDDFGAIMFTSGFRPDYASWIHFPAFDDMGFPLATDGASDVVPGLYFCGVHFLRKRKSAAIFGVGEDATVVAHSVAAAMVS